MAKTGPIFLAAHDNERPSAAPAMSQHNGVMCSAVCFGSSSLVMLYITWAFAVASPLRPRGPFISLINSTFAFTHASPVTTIGGGPSVAMTRDALEKVNQAPKVSKQNASIAKAATFEGKVQPNVAALQVGRVNITGPELHAAVLIVGHARSLAWKMVCENLKRRLVDALAKPNPNGGPQWIVEVFLFLSLKDEDSRKGRVAHKYSDARMQTCIEILLPVHVEYMKAVYHPPKEHGCRPGTEPSYITHSRKKTKDFPTRIFSQCHRVDLAQEYIQNIFEPKVHRRYDVLIKARPDAIYLTDLPPLWQFNLSHMAFPAGGYSDTWRLGPGSCPVVDPFCTQCLDAIKDTCYHGPQKRSIDLDPRVHPVLAREMPRAFFDQNHIKLPNNSSARKDGFGWLHLECSRWKDLMRKRAPGAAGTSGLCEAEAQQFLHASPPL